ncbi:hypothetical protein EVAR_68795_1 [Eumeta japonica]|uniref:Uncharacterized protein n=1 Tax=Eumeta variegata TaxID=151549 RepID=A0A4C1ZV98_EUMVA|nr:hypothetical protein EVAR_68795_1 [Eumeta japonica]
MSPRHSDDHNAMNFYERSRLPVGGARRVSARGQTTANRCNAKDTSQDALQKKTGNRAHVLGFRIFREKDESIIWICDFWICEMSEKHRYENSDVKERCGLKDVATEIENGMLRWFSHLKRMNVFDILYILSNQYSILWIDIFSGGADSKISAFARGSNRVDNQLRSFIPIDHGDNVPDFGPALDSDAGSELTPVLLSIRFRRNYPRGIYTFTPKTYCRYLFCYGTWALP